MIRNATAADLPAITALYAREVLTGTATFEEIVPSMAEMDQRMDAIRRKGLPWLVAEVDGAFAGYAYLSPFQAGRPIATPSKARSMSTRSLVGTESAAPCCQV